MLVQYFLKLSISLAIVWLFYQCVLRRLTFYGANRWYLAGYSLLCFFIPFININPFLESNMLDRNSIVDLVPSVEKYTGSIYETVNHPLSTNTGGVDRWNWVAMIFVAGTVILLFQFIIRFISFLRMRRKAQLISTDGLHLYQVNDSIIPFSFGNAVFINADLHTETELQEIIRHEFVHVKNRHTLDILWSELVCILNWYNPFAWLLKSSIRQNLEFIADNKVLGEGLDKRHYQYLLLKVIGNNHFSIAPKFNFSSLKKRIAMMNKFKSARVSALRFLFLIPLLSVLLLAFRQVTPNKHMPDPIPPAKQAAQPPTLLPVEMPDNVVQRDTVPDIPLNDKGYFVDLRGKGAGRTVVVWDKNGNELKRIALADWKKNEKEYTDRYGDIVPPPPPVPPVPPAKAKTTIIDIVSDDFNITEKEAIIKLKNGDVEHYDLKNEKERQAFEKKYGKIVRTAPKVSTASVGNIAGETVVDVAPVIVNTPNTASTTNSPTRTSSVNVVNTSNKPASVARVSTQTVIAPMKATAGESVTIVGDDDYTVPGKEEILATITKKTTQAELEELKAQLKKKGITLSFETTEYNSKGVLVNLYGSMKSSDGSTNFVAKDFSKLVISIIKNGDRAYFKVTVWDKKASI